MSRAGMAMGKVRTAVAITLVVVLGGASPASASAGALDPSFGSDGKATTDFSADDDRARGLALQPDGRIVAVGYLASARLRQSHFALARYTPDGILDPTFGDEGRVVVPFEGTAEGAGVAVAGDGGIVAAGYAQVGETFNFAVVRYRPDGTPDPAFGGDGIVTSDLSGKGDIATSVALQPDGAVVVAGCVKCLKNASHFAVARYLPDGTLDPAFGAGTGWVATDFDQQADEATAVLVEPDGRIVAAGFAAALEPRGIGPGSRNVQFGLARYLPDGSLDPSFGGGDGKVTTDFAEGNDAASGLARQIDGKLVAAGLAYIDGGFDFALARYLPDGSLDPTFGRAGKASTNFAPPNPPAANADGSYARGDAANAVAVQADGFIVAAGVDRNGESDDFALTRYSPNGTLDPTFGRQGLVKTDFAKGPDEANAVLAAPDGTIIVGGVADVGRTEDFAVVRYQGRFAPDAPPARP